MNRETIHRLEPWPKHTMDFILVDNDHYLLLMADTDKTTDNFTFFFLLYKDVLNL